MHINFHPTAQPEVPGDYDGALNRKSACFSDRSRQEEAILILMSDYVGLIGFFINLAKEGRIKEERINNLLGQPKDIVVCYINLKSLGRL